MDETTALFCELETRADLALVVRRSLNVLWDLRGLTGYSLEARGVFVRLQQFLSSKTLRTAYLAQDPVARSLALWAARMGNQSSACIAADHDAAAAWLAGQDESAVRIVVPHIAEGLPPASPGAQASLLPRRVMGT
jgi:hypothetical protein